MRALVPFRAAAILLLLFAAGHTIGFLHFRPASTAGRAVLQAMETVPVGMGRTYADLYRGFGLFVSAALLLAAAFAWWLGGVAYTLPRLAVAPAIALVLFQIAALVITIAYFGTLQIAFSALVLLALLLAVWSAARSVRQ